MAFGVVLSALPALFPAQLAYIISPHPPKPLQVATTTIPHQALTHIANVLGTVGTLLQLLFNARNRTFAGCYKISAYARCVISVFAILAKWQVLVGPKEASLGITFNGGWELLLSLVMAYQAVILKRVKAGKDKEEE